MSRLLVCCLSCIILGFSEPSDAEDIRFVVPNFSPYTYQEDGNFKGIGVERVTSAIEALGKTYSLTLAPNYGRALAELIEGRADAFFLATENTERNAVALFSAPITFNRWSWFFLNERLNPQDPVFKSNARIGTILNTNTHKWLLKNHFNVGFAAHSTGALIKLLKSNRIDAAFLAETVFLETWNKNIKDIDIYQTVEISHPFGVYFAKKFLVENEGFLTSFNDQAKRLNFPR